MQQEVVGIIVENAGIGIRRAELIAVCIHNNVLVVNFVQQIRAVVGKGCLLGVNGITFRRIDDCLVADLDQNIVADLRKVIMISFFEFKSINVLAGFQIKNSEESLVELIFFVWREGIFPVCGIIQRLILIGCLFCSGKYQNIARPHIFGLLIGEGDDRRVKRDQDFTFSSHKAGAVDFAIIPEGDAVEIPSEVGYVLKGAIVDDISLEVAKCVILAFDVY